MITPSVLNGSEIKEKILEKKEPQSENTVETQKAVDMNSTNWINVKDQSPPIADFPIPREKPYVLAVDAKGRMSVGYAMSHSQGFYFVCAKPIGNPTHWMPLPNPPVVA